MAITPPPARLPLLTRLRDALGVFRQIPGTFRLLWAADARGTILIALLTIVAAIVPVAIAWTGKLIIDAIVTASRTHLAADQKHVLMFVLLEFGLLAAQTLLGRTTSLLRELTGAKLGFDLNVKILEKALTLELKHFEDSEIYDKMQNARREASSRPLSLVLEAFAIAQNLITLGAYAVLLIKLSPWSVVILIAASIPAFVVETRMSGERFRL